jgi:TrmH family RNA methyltransferase
VLADLDGTNENLPEREDEKIIFALGNEGNGVSDKLKSLADFVFTVPFDNSAIESLNVSTAAAVGMYLLRKKDLN